METSESSRKGRIETTAQRLRRLTCQREYNQRRRYAQTSTQTGSGDCVETEAQYQQRLLNQREYFKRRRCEASSSTTPNTVAESEEQRASRLVYQRDYARRRQEDPGHSVTRLTKNSAMEQQKSTPESTHQVLGRCISKVKRATTGRQKSNRVVQTPSRVRHNTKADLLTSGSTRKGAASNNLHWNQLLKSVRIANLVHSRVKRRMCPCTSSTSCPNQDRLSLSSRLIIPLCLQFLLRSSTELKVDCKLLLARRASMNACVHFVTGWCFGKRVNKSAQVMRRSLA
jgi:hypothetical protein